MFVDSCSTCWVVQNMPKRTKSLLHVFFKLGFLVSPTAKLTPNDFSATFSCIKFRFGTYNVLHGLFEPTKFHVVPTIRSKDIALGSFRIWRDDHPPNDFSETTKGMKLRSMSYIVFVSVFEPTKFHVDPTIRSRDIALGNFRIRSATFGVARPRTFGLRLFACRVEPRSSLLQLWHSVSQSLFNLSGSGLKIWIEGHVPCTLVQFTVLWSTFQKFRAPSNLAETRL